MGRIAIYVNDALEAQLSEFKSELNWSRIAQDAFEQAIRIQQLKGSQMETSGIERLRGDRKNHAAIEEAEGLAAGKDWALNNATFEEVERVNELDLSDLTDRYDAQHRLAHAVFDGDFGGDDAEIFFEVHLGRQSPSIERISGFHDGVVSVFAEI